MMMYPLSWGRDSWFAVAWTKVYWAGDHYDSFFRENHHSFVVGYDFPIGHESLDDVVVVGDGPTGPWWTMMMPLVETNGTDPYHKVPQSTTKSMEVHVVGVRLVVGDECIPESNRCDTNDPYFVSSPASSSSYPDRGIAVRPVKWSWTASIMMDPMGISGSVSLPVPWRCTVAMIHPTPVSFC